MAGSNPNDERRCFYCDHVLKLPVGSSYCPHCGKPLAYKAMPDPEKQCGNCHEYFQPGDRYCRYCGTKKGEGAYAPYPDALNDSILYGPMPEKRKHLCKNCGYSWETCRMTDKEEYCPKCGGPAPSDDAQRMKDEEELFQKLMEARLRRQPPHYI